ncbi:MAG: MFS transporter, partial [Romboutsia sp.]|nr:MFS transporter [Romboutsia sp.]
DTGLDLMPGAILMGITSPITGILFDKYGARVLAIPGLIILTLGNFGLALLSQDTTRMYIIAVYAIRMIGIGMLLMPLTTSGLNSLHRSLYSHGNAANNTLRQVAGSIGTSIIITIMSKVTASSNLKNPLDASIQGMNTAFFSIACLTLLGTILAFFVIKKKEVKIQD